MQPKNNMDEVSKSGLSKRQSRAVDTCYYGFVGSNPTLSTNASITQLVECRYRKPKVMSSSLIRSPNKEIDQHLFCKVGGGSEKIVSLVN